MGGFGVEKNIKLIYCILGSTILALFPLPIFIDSLTSVFYMFELYRVGDLFLKFSKIISFIGAILMIYFSVKLILLNSILKDKEN